MKPHIFDGERAPEPFDTEVVKIDLTLASTLTWTVKPTSKAIFWELDLGLFDRLAFDLTSESQVRTLGLGLQHFAEKLLPHYQTVGASLWRGTLDFQAPLPFQSPFERRDVVLDFVEQLSYFLPEELPLFLLLDARKIQDPLEQILLLDPGKRGRVGFAVRGALVSSRDFIWEESGALIDAAGYIGRGESRFNQPSRRALLLSNNVQDLSALKALYERLEQENISYRLVSEETLTGEWDGLDELFVLKGDLSPLAKRKLAAFEAAGGVVN